MFLTIEGLAADAVLSYPLAMAWPLTLGQVGPLDQPLQVPKRAARHLHHQLPLGHQKFKIAGCTALPVQTHRPGIAAAPVFAS